jgi:hypothetical protein
MTTQLYYETVRDGLVPVTFVKWKDHFAVVVKVSEPTLCYKAGEEIETSPFHVVTKAPDVGHQLMVRQAALPRRS